MKPAMTAYRISFTLAGLSRVQREAVVLIAKSDDSPTRSAMQAIAALYGRESEEVFIHQSTPLPVGTAILLA